MVFRTTQAIQSEEHFFKDEPYYVQLEMKLPYLRLLTSINCLFTSMHKVERSTAVVIMVDMSGSTKGWINEAERESLLLLAEH